MQNTANVTYVARVTCVVYMYTQYTPSEADGVVLLGVHSHARHPLRQLLQLAQDRPLPLQISLTLLAAPFYRYCRSGTPCTLPPPGCFLVPR